MKTIFALLIFVSLAFSQYVNQDYAITFDAPDDSTITEHLVVYWVGNDPTQCPLVEDMDYKTLTLGDTIVSAYTNTLHVQIQITRPLDGFWHAVGVVEKATNGRYSLMNVSPVHLKAHKLLPLQKVRNTDILPIN